ncbi:MAG: DinB family protein [Deltaproteobacteria bacterium]|jgi:hypothetical protein|nr:DinB family protein [Deltaproteobacteria bacterium]
MTETIVDALKTITSGNYSLFDRFLNESPKDIWESKFGGWPIWQQFVHTLFVNVMFLPTAPQKDFLPGVSLEISTLKEMGTTPFSQESAKKSYEEIKRATFDYLDTLKDADLTSLGKKMGETEFSHLKIITLLNGHLMYHLGIFDAALREKNLPGII